MIDKKIGFIGVGNMASAMIRGILSSGLVASENVCGSCLHTESARARADELGVCVGTSNAEVVKASDVVFLTCKPYQLADVFVGSCGSSGVRELFDENKLIVSVVAGVKLRDIEAMLVCGGDQEDKRICDFKIIRCMPNTPAFVGAGVTSYCANKNLSVDSDASQDCADENLNASGAQDCALDCGQDCALVEQLFGTFGTVERISEDQMDAVTAVGGSSPAFVYAFIEALADGGVAEGLPRATAQRIAAQTVLGSAKMVLESGKHPAVLKDEVCSPAGTTIRGMEALERGAFRGTVIDAVRAAVRASRVL